MKAIIYTDGSFYQKSENEDCRAGYGAYIITEKGRVYEFARPGADINSGDAELSCIENCIKFSLLKEIKEFVIFCDCKYVYHAFLRNETDKRIKNIIHKNDSPNRALHNKAHYLAQKGAAGEYIFQRAKEIEETMLGECSTMFTHFEMYSKQQKSAKFA